MADSNEAYAGDDEFWKKYIKGRPQIPKSCFRRICNYHAERGGHFGTVNDVGAGVGVQSKNLAEFFDHVIVSDIVAGNVERAKERLQTEKYSYRAAKIEDASDLSEGSVDMVFAAFAMHHAQFDEAFEAIAKQLKPGGTFAAVIGMPGIFEDPRVTDVWHRIWDEGLRMLLRHAQDRNDRLRTLGHAGSRHDTMPLDEKYFRPDALRIAVNSTDGTWPSLLPDDLQAEFDNVFGSSDAVGPNDQVVYEDDSGWSFRADVQFLRDEYDASPFASLEPKAFEPLWAELEKIFKDGKTVGGVWPAKITLASRK